MINASTSLLPLLTLNSELPIYFNASVLLFSLVACINHVLPENLDGLTHLVKMLFTNILFSSMGNMPPLLGVIISLIDLTPLFSRGSRSIKIIGESLLQVPRLLLEVYLIYINLYLRGEEHYPEILLILICKVIYYFERKARIKKGIRNDFSSWHAVEHVGLYLLFKNISGIEFSIIKYACIIFPFAFINAIFIHLINVYLHVNMLNRAPEWLSRSSELKQILNDKLIKNRKSKKPWNYIIKPWASHLKLEFVSWNAIENICSLLVMNVNPRDYDLVIGVTTGGSFVGTFVAMKLNLPYVSIQSKLWSDISFMQNFYQSYMLVMGQEQTPKMGEAPDVRSKRILLVDDTTYSGITLKGIRKMLLEKGKAKIVDTMVMWMKGKYTPDHYYSNKRIPIIWEWGCEVD
jgi:hypoxanthine phosphoribosyltransferase